MVLSLYLLYYYLLESRTQEIILQEQQEVNKSKNHVKTYLANLKRYLIIAGFINKHIRKYCKLYLPWTHLRLLCGQLQAAQNIPVGHIPLNLVF